MNHFARLLILLFFISGTSYAQQINNLLEDIKEAKDTSRVIILNQLSQAYFKSELKSKKGKPTNKEISFKYASEALKLSENLKYKKGIALSYFNLGKIYLDKKDYRGAELAFLNSSELAKELKEHDLVLKNIDYIFKFHKELGNTNNSIAYADMKSAYKSVMLKELKSENEKMKKEQEKAIEKISSLDSLLKIEEAKTTAAVAKIKEVEASRIPDPVTIIKYKSKTDYKIAVIFFFLLMMMTASALWFMHLKNRNKRMLVKAESKIEQLLKKLAELKKGSQGTEGNMIIAMANLNSLEEMNLKIAQLLSQANFIIQKNELLIQLEDNFNGLKESRVEELSNKLVELEGVINNNYDAAKDWKDFLIHFENVYPAFLREIKENNNSITEVELKITAMQKIDLTVHEMARILHLSEMEVENAIVNLVKKQEKTEA